MSRRKQWVKEPKGALPGGIVTKAGIALIAVLIAGMLFSWSLTGPEADPTGAATPPGARAVNDGMGRAFQGRSRTEEEREAQQAAAAEARDEMERRRAGAAENQAPAGAASRPGSGPPGTTRAEFELREALRLEEIERQARSLRSLPVARTCRDPGGVRGGGGASPAASEPPEAALDAALASFERSIAALEGELATGLAGQPLPASPGVAPPSAPRTSATAEPVRMVRPDDPPVWSGSTRARSSKPCC